MQLAVGSWQLAVCSWQLAVGSLQLAVLFRSSGAVLLVFFKNNQITINEV
jgi:hypothetical protein